MQEQLLSIRSMVVNETVFGLKEEPTVWCERCICEQRNCEKFQRKQKTEVKENKRMKFKKEFSYGLMFCWCVGQSSKGRNASTWRNNNDSIEV